MAQINAEEMYNWYVKDVIGRNETAMAFKEQCKKHCEAMPLENVRKYVEDFYNLEHKYRGTPDIKTDDNDFKMFKNNIRVNVIIDNFADRPETLASKSKLIAARENGDEKALHEIVNGLYKHFGQEITDKKLEEKAWKNKLVFKATEVATRKIVGQDFHAEFDGSRDGGNCTKGITVSLSRTAEQFNLSLFSENTDKENLAHPKDFVKELEKYAKTSESGQLKDIENIRKGDIVLLFNGSGQPRHAMMVSGFDDKGEPLLLGFSPIQKNVPMFASKSSKEPRKGLVIDVHSFIADKVQAHNRHELAQAAIKQKSSQTR